MERLNYIVDISLFTNKSLLFVCGIDLRLELPVFDNYLRTYSYRDRIVVGSSEYLKSSLNIGSNLSFYFMRFFLGDSFFCKLVLSRDKTNLQIFGMNICNIIPDITYFLKSFIAELKVIFSFYFSIFYLSVFIAQMSVIEQGWLNKNIGGILEVRAFYFFLF